MGLPDKFFGIHQFAGEGFDNWSFRVKSILKKEGCLKAVTDDPPASNSDLFAKWESDNANAEAIIIGCVAESHLQYIREQTTAKEMWNNLATAFSKANFCSETLMRRKLQRLRVDESKSFADFFVEFDDLICQLSSINVKLTERDRVRHLFDALPESFDPLITALENLKDEELTLAYVKSRLLAEELKRKERNVTAAGSSNSSAFVASGNKKQMQHRFKGKCHECNEVGHKAYQCPKRKSNVNKKKNQRESNLTQGKARVAFTSYEDDESESEDTVWILDSGATDHQTNCKAYLEQERELQPPISIRVAKEGQCMMATKIGNISAVSKNRGEDYPLTLKDVLYIPELRRNLLSIKKMTKEGVEVKFSRGGILALISFNGEIIGTAKNTNGLYEWRMSHYEKAAANLSAKQEADLELWHKRFGHLNFQSLCLLSRNDMVKGLPNFSGTAAMDCVGCIQGKQSRQPFSGHRERARRPLERIHADVCGPITPQTWDGKRYFVTFTDDFTHFSVVYLIREKSEVFSKFKEYEAMATARFGTKISCIRSDNGGEFVSGAQLEYYKKQGIQFESTVAYTPQQNGVAERLNRTLVEKTRSMISDIGLAK